MNKKNNKNDSQQIEDLGQSSKNNLDDYSIAEQHESDPMVIFFTNLRALLKKKFLL